MTNRQKYNLFWILFLIEFILTLSGIMATCILYEYTSKLWIPITCAASVFGIIMPIIILIMIKLCTTIDLNEFKPKKKTVRYHIGFANFESVKWYMESKVFAPEDYSYEVSFLENTGETVNYYTKFFFPQMYKNIYVLVHLNTFDEYKGLEICKHVEQKIHNEFNNQNTAVYFILCIDNFTDEYYKFYDMIEEKIEVKNGLLYSFLPVAFSLKESIMYMEIQEGFIKQIYNGMRDEFPLIFDLDENDIIKEYCSNCGKELADADVVCNGCGTKREVQPAPQQAPVYEQTAPQQSPIYEQPVYAAPVYEAVPNKPQVSAAQNVLSIIGMILGIIGSLWTFFAFFSLTHPAFKSIGYSVTGCTYAIPGMILSCIGNKSGLCKMGKIGKIFNLISLILFGVFLSISIINGVANGFGDPDTFGIYYFIY